MTTPAPASGFLADADRRLRRCWRYWRNRRWPEVRSWFVPRRLVEAQCVAVAVGVLNRSGSRIEALFRSLRAQTLPPECVDITVCDLGSTPDHLADLRQRCHRYQVRLVALHLEQPAWSRARAINAALRQADPRARYVYPTDVDMLFAPDFMAVLVSTHLAMGDRAFVISDALDLPSDCCAPDFDVTNRFDQLVARSTPRDCLGSGACQSATAEWFHRIHGYDERIVGWGSEDDDLLWRARHSGLVPVDIRGRTHLLHQWHESERDRMAREGRLAEFVQQWDANTEIAEHDPTVDRNPQGWGELGPHGEVIEP